MRTAEPAASSASALYTVSGRQRSDTSHCALDATRPDTTHVFAVGYSSGSWLVNSLDCRRADKLRGAASVSGGVQGNNCSGRIARIFLHDSDDMNNVIGGSYKERDRLIALNHCTMTTMPDGPTPCVPAAPL